MKTKTILILSGGMDSTVLLYHLLSIGHEVRALGINYGQRHVRELECAAEICKEVGVEFRVADLTALKPLMGGSSQTDDSVPVPEGHYEEASMKKTVVPFRNGLMLSVAAAWAISTKSNHIAFAAHAGDHAVYPDCREEFASAFNTTLLLGDWHQASLIRPFVTKTKADIVQIGQSLQVPFEKTHTCYAGTKVACGRCGTCCERISSFAHVGAVDPLQYKDGWKKSVDWAVNAEVDFRSKKN